MRRLEAAVLGIDTSAYTTSVALVCGGRVIGEARRVLAVESGQRGLRPSEAVFRHLQNLPELIEEAWAGEALAAVAVAVAPRPQPASYLPSFRAGETVGRILAKAQKVPLWLTSHQEGHLAAGVMEAGGPEAAWFWALHVSGGTTELLRVRPRPGGFAVQQRGGTADLYAGQLVDRVGVALGLPFPAGPALEQLSLGARDRVILPVGAVRFREGQAWISFSGPEAAAQRAIALGADPAAVARGVEECVARGLVKLVEAGCDTPAPLLVVGGVAANGRVRRVLQERLGPEWPLYWASPARSRDNAVGVAGLGADWLAAGGAVEPSGHGGP